MSIRVWIEVRLPERIDGADAHRYERVLVGLLDCATWENEGLAPPDSIASRLIVDVGDPRGAAVARAAAEQG